MAQMLVSFRESGFSPWGARPRSRSGSRSPLPDASQKYSSCVGCISSVNHILGERGLQYSGLLPSLVSTTELTTRDVPTSISGLSSSSEDLSEDISLAGMANTPKKRKKKRIRLPKGPTKKVLKAANEVSIPVTDEGSKLVELASFPGYDPHTPTPLPHKLDPLEQMRRTSRAQTMLYLKREGFKDAWKKLFYNPASQAIFQDYFWWYFLHCYQRCELVKVQDQLFNRISANYVRLLCEDIDTRWKDPFFKVYPDLIAQCVYSTFIHAYPASWSSFDEKFKSELTNYISLWQVGTRPIANAWKKWELSILEPTKLLKKIGKDNSDEHSPRKRTPFELDTLINELEQKEKLDKSLDESDDDDDDDIDDVASKKSADPEFVRISFSDFEDKLVSSKEQLQITNSREKIIRTQAQATQAQLTDNVREETKLKAQPHTGTRAQTTTTKKPSPTTAKIQQVSSSQGSKQQQNEHQARLSTSQQATKSQHPPKQQQSGRQPKLAVQQRSVASNLQQPPNQQQSEKPVAHQQKPAPSNIQERKIVPRTEMPPKRIVTGPNKPAGRGKTVVVKSTAIKTTVPNVSGGNRKVTVQTTSSLQHKSRAESTAKATHAAVTKQTATVRASTSQKPIQAVKNSESTQQSPPKQEEVQRTNEKAPTVEEKSGEEGKSATVWKDKAVAIMQQRKESDSDNTPVPIDGPKFDHVRFDIYGQSPLVKHYLKERALSRKNEAKVLVGRTELVEEPPPNAVSYQHLLANAQQEGKKNYVQFEKHYRQQKRAIAHSHTLRMQANRKHEQDVKKLLSHKREVRNLSNEITTHVLGKCDNGKETISSAIKHSLNRVSKT